VPGADASVRKSAADMLFETYRIADDMLKDREFFFDHFTAADAHFFWCLRRGVQLGVEHSGFPNCVAHFERIKARPSVQKLLAFEKSVLDGFSSAA